MLWNGFVSIFLFTVIVPSFRRDDPEWFVTIFMIPFVLAGLGLIAAMLYQLLASFNPRPGLTLAEGRLTQGAESSLSWSFSGRTDRIRRQRVFPDRGPSPERFMSLEIRLEETALEPGTELRGRVDWRAEGDAVESVVVSLLWYTEGKGTEDVDIVEQVDVEYPSVHGSREFSFRLPDFPWSFSGTLVSVVWAVEASLEPGGAVERVILVSAPEAREITL